MKTDAADALLLGALFYKEEFEPYKKRGQHLMKLRYLTRQYESLTGMYVQAKLQFQAILDQVFPEYHGVFGDLYSKVSLRLLDLHPTSREVLELDEKEIAATIGYLTGRGKSALWCLERAQILVAAAKRNPFKQSQEPIPHLDLRDINCGEHIAFMSSFGNLYNFLSFRKDKKLYP